MRTDRCCGGAAASSRGHLLPPASGGSVGLAALVLMLGMLGSGCKEEENPLRGVKSQMGWKAHRDTPVIQAGDLREQGLWNDPSVIKEAGQYVMYLTTSTERPFHPPILPFRAVSDDGIHWALAPKTPLLTPEGTPFVSLETPTVVTFDGRYHMYYTGIYPKGQVPPMAIGHAVSDDGINWRSDSSPVLVASGTLSDWNGYLVAEPGALVHDGSIHLYFTAVGARQSGDLPQLQSIGLAKSADGRRFDIPQPVLGQLDGLYSEAKGFVGYSTPAPFLLEGRVHLVFDVVHFSKGANPEWRQVALHHAVSMDGNPPFVQDALPLVQRNSFSWTKGEILAPTALVDGNQLKIWFAGHVGVDALSPLIQRGFRGPEFGIGYVVLGLERFHKRVQAM